MIVRIRGPQERSVHPLLVHNHGESENTGVELERRLQLADEQNRVIEFQSW